MKRYKDPFEAAIEEEHDESPLDSPVWRSPSGEET
uniref:Uncharacterized protein n=1 Tax=Brassica campestris TaxID=3711 RepID=A0A3P5YGN5_BRACM|nr:unnamed protein product [Brassica rapa]